MAAGDLALSLILSATNAASPVIDEVVASVNAVQASVDSLSASFAALDASSSSVDASLSAIDASAGAADASLSGFDASASGTAASLTELAAANGEAVVSFGDMATALAYVDGQLAIYDATVTTTGAATTNAAMTMKDLEKAQRAAFESQSAMLGGMQQIGAALGTIVLVGTAVAAILGVVAVKAAADFQSGLTTLVTGAGELQSNLKMVGDGILKMAVDTGTSTTELVQGMYMIESSGQRGAQALDTLRAAAEGAKVGAASLADVANGATTIMTDYATQHVTAAQAVNTLITAVREGKSHLADMSQAMATILPTSAAVGVQLRDVAAAMATMTNEGTPAASAATYLKQMLLALEAPAKNGVAALKSIGLTSGQVAAEMRTSLPGALEMITEALNKKFPGAASVADAEFHKVTAGTETLDQALSNLSDKTSPAYVEALKNIAGGSRQMQGMLELTGAHLGVFRDNVNGITSAVNQGKGSIAGWTAVQQDFNFKLSQAGAAVQVLFIQLGTALLPVLGQLVGAVTPLISRFTAWASQGNNLANMLHTLAPALTVLAVLIGGVLVVALYAYASAALAAAITTTGFTWPILLVIAAIAALVGIIVLLVQHWNDTTPVMNTVRTSLTAVWNVLKSVAAFLAGAAVAAWNGLKQAAAAVWPILQQIGAFVGGAFIAAWHGLQSAIGPVGGVINTIAGVFNQFMGTVHQVAAVIGGQFTTVWNAVRGPIALAGSILGQVGNIIRSQLAPVFQQLQAVLTGNLLPAWNGIKQAASGIIPILTSVGQIIMSMVIPVWQSFQTVGRALMPLLQQIGALLGGQLLGALKAIGIVIGGIVVVAIIGFISVLVGIINALAHVILGVVQFVSGFIQLITGLVQIVIGIFQLFFTVLRDIFTGNWSKIGSDAAAAWATISDGLNNIVQGMWTMIVGLFNMSIGAIIGFFQGFVTTLIGIATSLYHALVGGSIFPDLVNGIIRLFTTLLSVGIAIFNAIRAGIVSIVTGLMSTAISLATGLVSGVEGAFRGLIGGAAGIFNTVKSTVLGVINGLASAAFSAAQHVVQSIINGINSMLGGVASAAGNIAKTIANFLPHSPAKEGPLTKLDTFMPGMIETLTQNIEAGIPSMSLAMHHLIEPMASSLSPTGNSFAGKGYPTGGGSSPVTVIQVAVQSPSIMLDGTEVTKKIMDRQATEIRRQGIRNR